MDRYARMLGVAPAPVFTVGDARLEIVPGPVTRLAAMTIAGDGPDLELTEES